MSFGILTLQFILHSCFGIVPDAVNLETDFRRHLHLTDAEIGRVLSEITKRTGLPFTSDTAEHLTDVFDLLIHVILRLHEQCDTDYYFGPIPEKLTAHLSSANQVPTLAGYVPFSLN